MSARPERRILGRTGMSVSALGLGTVELGMDYGISAPGEFGRPSESTAVGLLRLAADNGVDFFDTAPGYGAAERLLGKALGDQHGHVFATKVAIPGDARVLRIRSAELRRHVERSLETSRLALRRGTLDVVQIHNATLDVLAGGELAEVLLEARARGEIRAIGASVYSEAEALAAIAAACFDLLQVPFNLLDRRMADRVFPAARDAGVAIVARSAFLRGVLTPRAKFLPPELAELVSAADRMREALGVPWELLPTAALRFCLYSPGVAVVIVGVRTADELAQALAAAGAGPLPAAVVRKTATFALTDERLANPSKWVAQ